MKNIFRYPCSVKYINVIYYNTEHCIVISIYKQNTHITCKNTVYASVTFSRDISIRIQQLAAWRLVWQYNWQPGRSIWYRSQADLIHPSFSETRWYKTLGYITCIITRQYIYIYIPRNIHTLSCCHNHFCLNSSGLLQWRWGNHTFHQYHWRNPEWLGLNDHLNPQETHDISQTKGTANRMHIACDILNIQ